MPGPASKTLWEADPFIEAAEDLQESVDRLEDAFHSWRDRHDDTHHQGQAEGAHVAVTPGEKVHVQDAEVSSLISICDNVRAQVGDFHKAVSAMTRNPEKFHVNEAELLRRFEFVKALSSVESAVRHALLTGNCDMVPARKAGERALVELLGDRGLDSCSASQTGGSRSGRGGDVIEQQQLLQQQQQQQRQMRDVEKSLPPIAGSFSSAPTGRAAVLGSQAGPLAPMLSALARNKTCIIVSSVVVGLVLWSAEAFQAPQVSGP